MSQASDCIRAISRILKIADQAEEHGNTVMIVEHHREVIALADHIVDMGPEAGIMVDRSCIREATRTF